MTYSLGVVIYVYLLGLGFKAFSKFGLGRARGGGKGRLSGAQGEDGRMEGGREAFFCTNRPARGRGLISCLIYLHIQDGAGAGISVYCCIKLSFYS